MEGPRIHNDGAQQVCLILENARVSQVAGGALGLMKSSVNYIHGNRVELWQPDESAALL